MKMRLEILIHYAKIRVYMVHGIPRVYIYVTKVLTNFTMNGTKAFWAHFIK